MKDIITGFAILLILIFFPLQWALNEVNHYRMQSVNNIVHNAAQRARIDGYFKNENIDELKQKLADALSINQTEISITATSIPKYRFDTFDRREMISYEVKVPIKKVVVMNRFFSISDTDNTIDYILKGEVASELLAP